MLVQEFKIIRAQLHVNARALLRCHAVQPLRAQRVDELIHAGEIAARPIEADCRLEMIKRFGFVLSKAMLTQSIVVRRP